MVPAQFTTCCTQCGELAAAGWMTCDGSPIAIFGWACKIPSKTQSRPKPIRSTWRHAGSAEGPPGGPAGPACPPAGAAAGEGPGAACSPAWAAGSHARTVIQASPSSPKISSAMIP